MKKVAGMLISLLIILTVFIGTLYFAQRSMIYVPAKQKPSIGQSNIAGLEEIIVRTKDGLSLFAWYKAPRTQDTPTILWFHGNASNVGITALRAIPFAEQGYGLLLAEYRGYASNPGKPTEEGLYNDARAYMNYLMAEKSVPENAIIIYGESIGSGPAVQMATENQGIHTLILEAPMSALLEIAAFHYPYLPSNLLLKDRYDNLSKIGGIKSPLILIHGERDTVIPFALGKKLFNAAPEPKSMITLPDAGHNDLFHFGAPERILSILAE